MLKTLLFLFIAEDGFASAPFSSELSEEERAELHTLSTAVHGLRERAVQQSAAVGTLQVSEADCENSAAI